MKKILLINGSPNQSKSIGLELSHYVVTKFSDYQLEEIELFSLGLQELSANFYQSNYQKPNDEDLKQLKIREEILQKFIAANTVIINIPIWNFGTPATVKLALDSLFVPGKTFEYQSGGNVVGLLKEKNVYILTIAGGENNSMKPANIWIKEMFNFLGINSGLKQIFIHSTSRSNFDAIKSGKELIDQQICDVNGQHQKY